MNQQTQINVLTLQLNSMSEIVAEKEKRIAMLESKINAVVQELKEPVTDNNDFLISCVIDLLDGEWS